MIQLTFNYILLVVLKIWEVINDYWFLTLPIAIFIIGLIIDIYIIPFKNR